MLMPNRSLKPGGWVAGAILLVAVALTTHGAEALAASQDVYAGPVVVAQIPTPTPFRFLTPTPFVPGAATTSATQTPPRAGGFPMELAVPVLIGGLAAIFGGSLLLRRKTIS